MLVEGDDFNEPICDAARGILDGHFILSRELAAAGHYPAIDIRHSLSRLTPRVSAPEQIAHIQKLREALALYHDSQDLIQLGAYAAGSNPKLDACIRLRPEILSFLKQDAHASRRYARRSSAWKNSRRRWDSEGVARGAIPFLAGTNPPLALYRAGAREAQLRSAAGTNSVFRCWSPLLEPRRSKLDSSLARLSDLRGQDLRAMAASDLRLRREIGNVMPKPAPAANAILRRRRKIQPSQAAGFACWKS